MKKLILLYGCVSGGIMALMLVISSYFMKNTTGEGKFEYSEIFGYTSMLLAMSMIFIGVHQYKNKYNEGQISFWESFKIGFWISLIAALFYVVTWALLVRFYYPTFMQDYGDFAIKQMQDKNKPVAEIEKMKTQIEWSKSMYSTWYGFAGITFLEIFPVGIFVSLLCSTYFLLRQKYFTKPVVPS